MSLYLTLMREDGRNVWAPYQLAVSSAEKGQTELAERYLQLSADRGLWYYYNLLEDDAFNSIQHSATYQSIWPPPKRAICSTPVTMKARPATRCRTEKRRLKAGQR